MSYTSMVKEEILTKEELNEEITTKEKLIEVSAFLRSKKSFYDNKIEIRVENKELAIRVANLLKEVSLLRVDIRFSKSKSFGEHSVYIITIPNQKGFKGFVESVKNDSEVDLSDEKIFKSFIKGIFLGCGYIKSPDKEYSLDLFIDDENIAKDLYEELKRREKRVFITKKKNKSLVYLRNGEDIMDILVYVDAIKNFFKYEETIIMKDLKNKTIREINWEVANETKTLDTGNRQVKAIEYLDSTIGIENLTPALREVAMIRRSYPEGTLSELAEKLGLSKSGIKNRLRRVEKMYNDMVAEEEEGN